MTEILLIRTGQTEWKAVGRLAGNAPLPLSEAGQQQCRELAARLAEEKLAALYYGGDKSAMDTGKSLTARLGGRLRKIEDLREVNCGLWQGLSAATLKARYPKAYRQWQESPLAVFPPEGENLEHAAKRIRRGLQHLGQKWPDRKIGVIMGDVALGLAYCMLQGEPACELWTVTNGQEQVYRCRLDRQSLEIR